MAGKKPLGIETEIHAGSPDTTPFTKKLGGFLKGNMAGIIPLLLIVTMFVFKGTALFFALIFIPLFYFLITRNSSLPFRKPESSKQIDPNELNPGTGKAMQAKGISFYGNDARNKQELWFSSDNVRTHTLIFGTTGSGKTEALVSLCVNSLIMSSGFIYVDGKGDNSLFTKIYSLARKFGREDDLLLINYMTGKTDPHTKTFEKMSNTLNPFANLTADAATELIVSLLPSDSEGMWKGRAAIFISSLISPLVALRNENKILLDINAIRKFFPLDKIEELVGRDDIKEIHKEGLKEYLYNLPGYKKPTARDPNPEQEPTVFEQHGYITMQFTEIFGLLADTYGKIMKTQLAECDFFDIVVQRRILVVLLPALEKSDQSLANLGKIIVSSVKNMMSGSLGSQVEGTKRDVLDKKPINSPSPYLTIFDEYGYYSVKGAAVMPAQARSLGFAMVFAGQDYQAFKKASPEEAASIVANCTIKICMKLEDPTETLDIFQKSAGEGTVQSSSGMQYNKESSMGGYIDSGNLNYNKTHRINARDLKAQGPGEAHILFGDNLVRAKMFFANPKQTNEFMLNSFIQVKPPSYEEVRKTKTGFQRIRKRLDELLKDSTEYQTNLNEILGTNGYSSELSNIVKAYKVTEKTPISNDLKAFFSLASYYEKVKFVDNKVILDLDRVKESEKVEEEKTQEDTKAREIERQKKLDEVKKQAELNRKKAEEVMAQKDPSFYSRNNDSVKKESNSAPLKDDGFIKRMRGIISQQTTVFEEMSANSYNPYDIMNIDPMEIQTKISNTENALNRHMKEVDLLDSDEMLNEDYGNLVGEQTALALGVAVSYPGENKLKSREINEKMISTIIDNIALEDIEDENE